MWQLCYFFVSLYDETLCISFGAHKPNRFSCPLCYMNVAMAIVVLLHVHVCSICHVIIYYCTLHWYHIAINLIWFDLNTETFDPPDTIVWYWIGTNINSGFTNVLLIRNVWLCEGLYTIITWLCDILALVWHFGPACVTFRTGLCDILALSCVTKVSACHHTPILTTGAVYRKFHRSSVSKTT